MTIGSGPTLQEFFPHGTHVFLGGETSIIFLIFTPNPGEMIQFDEHILQMGWFNHQTDEFIQGSLDGSHFWFTRRWKENDPRCGK